MWKRDKIICGNTESMLFPFHLILAFITITPKLTTRYCVSYVLKLSLLCCLLCSLQNYSIMEDNSILPDCGEEYNPCTELGMPSCDYLDIDSLHEMRPTKHDLSVMQLNIRGLLNKQD